MADTDVGGFVRFNITATPDEMRRWPTSAITQFFNGLAQMVYAAGANAEIEVVALNNGDTHGRDEKGEHRCQCGHDWDEHERPIAPIPWDICSFPCLKCDCTEFDEVN